MTSSVGIVDYGAGNLLSVKRALEAVGASVQLLQQPGDFTLVDRIVLPGVGAFGYCIDQLKRKSLFDPVKEYSQSGQPVLGICVGMQMLFDFGTENGHHESLGLIGGHVARLPDVKDDDSRRKLPHIGWSTLSVTQSSGEKRILTGLDEAAYMYFAHSYAAVPDDPVDIAATTEYEGHIIVAAVQRNNIFGLQGHPEKSAETGLKVLKQFVAL